MNASVERVRVLNAIGGLSKGGAEFQCRQLANHLSKDLFEVGVVYLHEGPNPKLHHDVRKFPVSRGSWSAVRMVYRQVDDVIKEFNPDVVHVWVPEIITVPAAISAYRRKIPIIAGLRNTLAFEGDWNKMARDRARGLQYLLADRIVSNFEVTEEPYLFKILYAAKNGVRIANGIGIDSLRSLPPRLLPVRAKYRIIFAGRVAYQKGLITIFEALKIMRDDGLDVHFTIFGEGHPPYVASLKKQLGEIGVEEHVTFYGECLNWQAFSQDADCLVSATLGEGTSNVILEALAVGLPVLISDIPMTRQILSHLENAYVVETRTGAEWAEAIKRVLLDKNLQLNLSAGARAVGEQFSLTAMVNEYAELYREAIRSNRNE